MKKLFVISFICLMAVNSAAQNFTHKPAETAKTLVTDITNIIQGKETVDQLAAIDLLKIKSYLQDLTTLISDYPKILGDEQLQIG